MLSAMKTGSSTVLVAARTTIDFAEFVARVTSDAAALFQNHRALGPEEIRALGVSDEVTGPVHLFEHADAAQRQSFAEAHRIRWVDPLIAGFKHLEMLGASAPPPAPTDPYKEVDDGVVEFQIPGGPKVFGIKPGHGASFSIGEGPDGRLVARRDRDPG